MTEEQKAAMAEGRRRAAAAREEAVNLEKPAKQTVSVTYIPLEHAGGHFDPPVIKWNGITFRANVPVKLDADNPDHHIMQLLPRTFPGTNGEVLTKHVECKVFMGEVAKGNPSFSVDGVRAKRKVSTRTVPAPGAEWTEAHEGQVSYSDQLDAGVAA
jgi:hypothetical protein